MHQKHCKQLNKSHYNSEVGNEWENVTRLILTTKFYTRVYLLKRFLVLFVCLFFYNTEYTHTDYAQLRHSA